MKALLLLLVFAAGFLLATRVIPFIFVRIGRLLGFRMQMNPLTRKRVQRFKRIKRGYYCFLAISVLFVTSLFLEVIVNHKPIYLRYQDNVAFPAVRDLGRLYVGWLFTISDFDRADEFGLSGDGQLDYRKFDASLENPEATFADQIEAKSDELEALKAEFVDLRAEIEEMRENDEEPEDWLLEDLASAEKEEAKLAGQITALKESREVFAGGGAAVIWPLYRFSPYQNRLDLPGSAPFPPTLWREREVDVEGTPVLGAWDVPLGTDPSGVDVLPQLAYGFRVSVAFALIVLLVGYTIGVFVGGMMGYYGGWTDIGTQRVIEVWGAIPFLFTIMIIAEIVHPSFFVLAVLMILLRSWLAITELIRGEFYREKARDYVQAAIGTGMRDIPVMMRHILPNSLVPVVSRAPFSFVNYIIGLVSLDYLGFGLPPGTPSWGGMLRQAVPHLSSEPHLVLLPVVCFAMTLLMVVLIGEAVREGFDPKVFSRLR